MLRKHNNCEEDPNNVSQQRFFHTNPDSFFILDILRLKTRTNSESSVDE
jgi:hypothetical protein